MIWMNFRQVFEKNTCYTLTSNDKSVIDLIPQFANEINNHTSMLLDSMSLK